MGVCDSNNNSSHSNKASRVSSEPITLNNFIKINAIGKGGFGKVWKVQCKKTQMIYAMKEMSKVKIYKKKSLDSIANEQKLLSYLRHPFLINMVYAFQDKDYLFIVLNYLQGGDLRYHLSQKMKFNEGQTILEYFEKHHIIHRDIKPENLVFDHFGFLHLTDLGVAKVYKPLEPFIDSSGTAGYMAPEVIVNKIHNLTADYFAIGVMTYELIYGHRPYSGKNRREIRDQMFSKEIQVTSNKLPRNWSPDICSFINGLLQRKPATRLGSLGINQIKEHPWLKGIDWEDLLSKDFQSPFIPIIGENYDNKYVNREDDIVIDSLYYLNLDKINHKNVFKSFYFNLYDELKIPKTLSKNIGSFSTNEDNEIDQFLKKAKSFNDIRPTSSKNTKFFFDSFNKDRTLSSPRKLNYY